jgi:hypothetical protein
MWSARASLGIDDEPLPQLDAWARRSLGLLCVAYLLLAVPYTGYFLVTDLPELLDRAADARSSLAAVEGQPDIPRAVIEQAADDVRVAAAAARRGWLRAAVLGGVLAALMYFLMVRRKRVETRAEAVSAATMVTVLVGVALVASRLVLETAMPERSLPAWGIADLFVMHLVACMIVPWTPRESVPPFVLLLLVWAATFLIPSADPEMEILDRVVAVIVSPAILVPGLAIAGWRIRRLREDAERLMLDEQVRTIGGELSRARIVHDAMFPKPFDTGYIRFEYDYRPIAEIGGDYVHLHVCPLTGRIYLTVLDVAGHGLAAALTVNRLFGELERIRAEDPDAEPAQVMELLNRYIHLTMAPHSLYATSACIMLEPSTGEVKWVNAGHPPALIRKVTGELSELAGTTMLLGAQSFAEFEPNQKSTQLGAGDVIIAYTDGAFEARNPQGQRLSPRCTCAASSSASCTTSTATPTRPRSRSWPVSAWASGPRPSTDPAPCPPTP